MPKGWTGEYLLVGEGPGRHEDEESGRPFTGDSGVLLRKTLRELGISDRAVALVNAVRCRPPGNRTPSMLEIRACRPFLLEVIGKLKPAKLIALGTTALAALRNSNDNNITRARGRKLVVPGEIEGDFTAWATYHPSSVLRGNTQYLEKIREDLVRTWGEALAPIEAAPDSPALAIDTEFSPEGELLTVGVADGRCALATETTDPLWRQKTEVSLEISEWLIGHSVAGDVEKLVEAGFELPESFLDGSKTLDSLLLARMVDETRGKDAYELESLALDHFPLVPWKHHTVSISKTDATKWPVELRKTRCALDAWASWLLAEKYAPLVPKDLREYTHRTAATINRICLAGLVVDVGRFNFLGDEAERARSQAADLLEREALRAGMGKFSPTNDNHIRELLYTYLGLPVVARTEKSDLPSVDKTALHQLNHPVSNLLLEFSKWDKAYSGGWAEKEGSKSKPIKSLLHLYGGHGSGELGYLPLHINPLGAKTGRRSSNGPNCQNWEHDFRSIVTSRFPGGLIGDHDYRRLEVVLFAYVSGDEELLDYFVNGDGYAGVAKWLWGREVVKGTVEYRTTKSIILGILYNMRAFLMAHELWYKDNVRLDPSEETHLKLVSQLRKKFLRRFKGVSRYIAARREELLSSGQVKSLLGRIRHLPCPDGPETPGFGRLFNQAVNCPIQSLASDVTASALMDVEAELLKANGVSLGEFYRALVETRKLFLTGGPKCEIIPTYDISVIINEVHDDVVVDFHPAHLTRDREIVIETMRAVKSLRKLVGLEVKLDVDQSISTHWGVKN